MHTFTPEEIKKLRKRLKCTQAEFASKTGAGSYITVQHWEYGRRNPSRASQILMGHLRESLKIKKS